MFTSSSEETLSLAASDLARSGLSLEDLLTLGGDVIDSATELGHKDARPAIVFPYWDPFENSFINPKDFHRVKLLGAPSGFLSQTTAPKYVQPAKSLNSVYIPRQVDGAEYDWKRHLTVEKTPIFITEGEKKAACACKLNLPTIGLGGVDMFRAQKRGVSELPILELIQFKFRDVTIIFDTDDANGLKPRILKAAQRLMDYLTSRGAVVSLLILPAGPYGEKVGLDDYLVKHGKDKFLTVLSEKSVGHSSGKLLCDAAERFSYIYSISQFVATGASPTDDIKIPKSRQQLDEILGMKKVTIQAPKQVRVPNAGWEVRMADTAVPISEALLQFGGLRQCKSMVYMPGHPRYVEVHGALHFNMWEGWRCEYENDTCNLPNEQTRSHIMHEWNWVLDNIFGSDPVAREFVEHWIYYPIKHPGAKLNTYILVTSPLQGIGKSFIGDMLGEYIYGLRGSGPKHASKIVEGRFEGDFNGFLYATSLVLGEEIASSHKRSVYERVKSYVSSETIEINLKRVQQFTIENCANFWLSSNEDTPFFLAQNDRRGMVHCPMDAKKDLQRFTALSDLFKQGLGGPTLLWYARERYDQKNFNPKEDAPWTKSKESVVQNSMSGIHEWLHVLCGRAANGLLTRPFATPKEIITMLEYDAPWLYRTVSTHSIAKVLASVGAVRFRDGAQISYKTKGVFYRERTWILGDFERCATMTNEQMSDALTATIFGPRLDDSNVVPMIKNAKY